MYSRFAEHDIACLVPRFVRGECLLLHYSRLGNLRYMRHYSKSREVTFRYSGDPVYKTHPKRTAGFCSQYTTPTGNSRQAVSLERKKYRVFQGPQSHQCSATLLLSAKRRMCCLQFICMPPHTHTNRGTTRQFQITCGLTLYSTVSCDKMYIIS